MKQKELTKTSMMISNWEKPFGLHGLYKSIPAFWGLNNDISILSLSAFDGADSD